MLLLLVIYGLPLLVYLSAVSQHFSGWFLVASTALAFVVLPIIHATSNWVLGWLFPLAHKMAVSFIKKDKEKTEA